MNVYSTAIRLVILFVTLVPRYLRQIYWTVLNALHVPLAITAPLGAAAAIVTFWAPLALLLTGVVTTTVVVVVWTLIAVMALLSAVRWLLVEVAADRI